MAYKLVIFDFDGTLADSFPWFLDVFDEVADKFEFRKLRRSEIDLVRSFSSRRLLSHFGVPRWKLPGIARHMRRLAARDAGDIRLFDGAPEMLNSLSERGVTLAIASSNTEANIRAVLGPRNAALISHYACGASLFGKRAKYRIIRKASGLPRGEILCIGDEVRDLEAARAEGLAFGAVAWGYASIEALEALDPDEVFETLDEIVPRVTAPADAAAASA